MPLAIRLIGALVILLLPFCVWAVVIVRVLDGRVELGGSQQGGLLCGWRLGQALIRHHGSCLSHIRCASTLPGSVE